MYLLSMILGEKYGKYDMCLQHDFIVIIICCSYHQTNAEGSINV